MESLLPVHKMFNAMLPVFSMDIRSPRARSTTGSHIGITDYYCNYLYGSKVADNGGPVALLKRRQPSICCQGP